MVGPSRVANTSGVSPKVRQQTSSSSRDLALTVRSLVSRERGPLRLQEAPGAPNSNAHARPHLHLGGVALRKLPPSADGDAQVRVSSFPACSSVWRAATDDPPRLLSEPKVKKVENPKFKEEEEALRKRFTEQVKMEEARFRQWEQHLIAERDRLNKDLEQAHGSVSLLHNSSTHTSDDVHLSPADPSRVSKSSSTASDKAERRATARPPADKPLAGAKRTHLFTPSLTTLLSLSLPTEGSRVPLFFW